MEQLSHKYCWLLHLTRQIQKQLHLQIILKNPLRSLGVVQGRPTPCHCVWRTAAWHAGQAYKHRFSTREFLSTDLFPKSWWQNCQIAGRYGLSCFIPFPIDCAIRPLSSLEKVFSLSSLTCMLSSPNLDSPVWSAHSIRWWQSWRTWSFVDDVTEIKGRVGNQSQVWHWAGSSSFRVQMYHSLLHYLWGWIILLNVQCLLQLIQNIKEKNHLKWGLVYLPTLDALPMYLKIFLIYCTMQSILEIFFFLFHYQVSIPSILLKATTNNNIKLTGKTKLLLQYPWVNGSRFTLHGLCHHTLF